MSVGLTADFGIKQETTYGTEATADVFIDILSESIAPDNAILTPKTANGKRSLKRVLPGPYTASGTVTTLASPEGVPAWLLKGLFGQVSSAVLAGTAYRHTFTPTDDTTLPSFTLYVDRVAGQFNYVGSVVSQLAITANVNEAVQFAFDFIAKNPILTSELAATYSTLREFIWSDATVSLNGSPNTQFENMNVTISNALEGVSTHNASRFISHVVATDFTAEGTLDLEFNDTVQLKRFWGNASATQPQNTVLSNDLTITWTSPDQIGVSGQYYTLELHIPELIYSTGEPSVSGANDRIMQPLSFVAREGDAEGYAVRIRLTNSETSYA